MNSKTSSSEQEADQNSETSQDADSSAGASAFASALAAQLEGDEDAGNEDDAGDDEDSGAPRESGKKVKLESLDTLAESLGVEVKDLYAIKVPGSGGRDAMTIGQIKDRFASFSSLEADRLALTERGVAQDAEFEQLRAEVRELLSVVPKENLSQDALKAAAARVAARNKADAAKVLVVMPEWRDQERRDADVADLTESLGKYGIPVSFLATVRNPALLKFMRDAARREKQVQAALATVKKAPKKRAVVENSGRVAPRVPVDPSQQQRSGSRVRPTSERERFSEALRKSK